MEDIVGFERVKKNKKNGREGLVFYLVILKKQIIVSLSRDELGLTSILSHHEDSVVVVRSQQDQGRVCS